MSDMIFDEKVKTQKKQTCWGCARRFPKGTVLEKQKTVDKGIFYTFYWCDVCRAYLNAHYPFAEKVLFGSLRDEDPEEWERLRKSIDKLETPEEK